MSKGSGLFYTSDFGKNTKPISTQDVPSVLKEEGKVSDNDISWR